MFLSNFYYQEAVFCTDKSSFKNIFPCRPSDNLNNLLINRLTIKDSPSKVIELKIIDPAEEKIDLSHKEEQTIFSTETMTKENIGDQ